MEITRYRGDTYADKFVITDSDGAVLDITGHSFKLTLNSNKTPSDATGQAYQLIGTITNGASGAVEFAPNATQANIVGRYYYDIQMTDDQGAVKTVQAGIYTYIQNITK